MPDPKRPDRSPLPITALAICATSIAVALIAAVAVLSLAGREVDPLIRLINTTFNALSVLLGSVGTVYAARGWRASRAAADRLNGDMDTRIHNGAKQATHEALAERGAPPIQEETTP